MKKRIVVLVVLIVFSWFSIKTLDTVFYRQFLKPNEFYQSDYDYSQKESNWHEANNSEAITQSACLNLYLQLKAGKYDEFKTNFINCYETVFDKECCYLVIRRVFVNDGSDLTLTEAKVLVDVLNEVVEIDKQLNDKTSINRNYSLQQEILYYSGRIFSAYKIKSQQEMVY